MDPAKSAALLDKPGPCENSDRTHESPSLTMVPANMVMPMTFLTAVAAAGEEVATYENCR